MQGSLPGLIKQQAPSPSLTHSHAHTLTRTHTHTVRGWQGLQEGEPGELQAREGACPRVSHWPQPAPCTCLVSDTAVSMEK